MFKKYWIFFFIFIALGVLLFWPAFSNPVEVLVLTLSIVITIWFTTNDHWQSYVQAEFTREKMIRNLTRDVFGLLLAMSAAIFAGGRAGQWAGMQAGLWVGLGAGFVVGFLAAWAVRSMWGRLVPVA